MFALLGQAGRLGLRAKRARRGDQASAADPAVHPARMRVLGGSHYEIPLKSCKL